MDKYFNYLKAIRVHTANQGNPVPKDNQDQMAPLAHAVGIYIYFAQFQFILF